MAHGRRDGSRFDGASSMSSRPKATAGTHYRYRLEEENGEAGSWPDPASRYQPLGVHGPSEVSSGALNAKGGHMCTAGEWAFGGFEHFEC